MRQEQWKEGTDTGTIKEADETTKLHYKLAIGIEGERRFG